MTSLLLKRARLLMPVSLLAAAMLGSCETPRMAMEGNPMPEQAVSRFLVVMSPKSAYDVPPKFVKGFAPDFPEAETYRREWGYANMEFTITTDGKADDMRIAAATAMSFAQEAYFALSNWRFKPAQKNGVAVPVRARMPFTFRFSH